MTRQDATLVTGHGRVDEAEVFDTEVFDTETLAALHGLRATLDLRTDLSHKIHILLDNQAAVNCLYRRPSESLQEIFLEFQRIVREGAT